MCDTSARPKWVTLSFNDVEQFHKAAGEIYDLLYLLLEASRGRDAESKGRRMILNQIVDRNTYVHDRAYLALVNAESDKEELAA